MKRYVVIVAGGKGSRMNAETPKQFILLGGKPVLMHTILRFHEADPSTEIIVALPGNEINAWKELCSRYSFTIVHKIAEGGESRFQSVKNGLALVREKSIVAVHDGARPFASGALINRCFLSAKEFGNAVPSIPVNESLRQVKGRENKKVERDSFVVVQTPQCFDSEILKEAYKTNYKNNFTDDASVVEDSGVNIHLVEGEQENIKITYPVDLLTGESLLKKMHAVR